MADTKQASDRGTLTLILGKAMLEQRVYETNVYLSKYFSKEIVGRRRHLVSKLDWPPLPSGEI